MSTTFVRGENPLYADKLNTAFSERVSRGGDTMQGLLRLAQDPVNAFDAATKQYVDRFTSMGVPTGAYIGASPPGNTLAPLWWDTVSGQLYIQYNDGSSTQWVSANSSIESDSAIHENIISVLDHGARGDGVTDDTAAIQSVLNTYAGKAIVFIPRTFAAGGSSLTYRTTKLRLPANTNLLLHGRLLALPGLTSSYIDVTNVFNITISGYGVIDANGPAQTAVGGMAGLGITNTTRVRVSGIQLTNAFHWNLNLTGSSDVVFHGVMFTKGSNSNEFAASSDNCWLVNCTIDGTGLPDYGFAFYGGVTNSGAIGNVVRNCGVGTTGKPPGIGILSDGISTAPSYPPCSNITIANNIIYNCAASGISCINVVSGGGGVQRGIIISGNRCYGNNWATSPIANVDIYIDQSNGVSITGNQLSGNGNAGAPAAGMFFGGNASHISATGNQIYNVGQGRTDGAGFWTNANDVFISGNYVYDSQTTPTMQYSVIGSGGVRSAIIGNFTALPVNVGSAAGTVSANAVNGVWTIGSVGGSTDHLMIISGAPSHRAGLQYTSQGNPRWLVGTDGTTDATGNVGSNYAIASYDGTATLQPAALSIERSTSKTTLAVAPTIGTLPTNATNDAAAASAGVPVGGIYRNASVLMIRTV